MVFGFLKACSFFDCAAYNESAPERTPEHLLEVRHFYVELFPLNDSRACGNCFLVMFHIVSSHSLLLVHGEYLHSSPFVGTHLELSRVSSSWNSLMGSILPDMGSIAPDLRFCRSIVME